MMIQCVDHLHIDQPPVRKMGALNLIAYNCNKYV